MHPFAARHRHILLLMLLLLAAVAAVAGSGPQNVLVVVNGNSAESLEIGNAYRRMRNIPYRQLLTINTATSFAIPYQTYLDEIETPIRAYLKSQQIEDIVTSIVLPRGVPQVVSEDGGRAVASLLAAMNLPRNSSALPARTANPYYNSPIAFSHRPETLRTMYLVTVLTGYNTEDVRRLIAQGTAADGAQPSGSVVFQNSPNIPKRAISDAANKLTMRSIKVETAGAPALDRPDLLAYLSGGGYSGLTREMLAPIALRPGVIADLAQNHSAAESNFDESATPVMLPVSAFVKAGVTGVHGVIGEAGPNTMPVVASPATLLDKYTSGFSLAESFFAALPYLNWQNIVIGDPLCAPYVARPIVTVEQDTAAVNGILPIRVSASASTRGTTISRMDLYLDGQFLRTLYEPEGARIIVRAGDASLTYQLPRGVTQRLLLLGLADAINADPALSGPTGVKATASLNTGTLRLVARTPGADGNLIPVSIKVEGDGPTPPPVTARATGDMLSGGGQAPTPARATISFTGRRIQSGDQVSLQVRQELLTYTVPAERTTIGDLLDTLVQLIESAPGLKGEAGVRAVRDAQGMPFITLEARTPGERGNEIPFQLTVKPTEGSPLRGYPDTPSHLAGGHNGSAATLDVSFELGEAVAKAAYLLDTTKLVDGYHRLRVVAVDGSPAQVQGEQEVTVTVSNLTEAPLVSLPGHLGPAAGEVAVRVTATAPVAQVHLYVDGKLLGTSATPPFAIRLSLAGLGRGTHDLWAEGCDANGNRFLTPPVPLQVLVPPQVSRITPDYAAQEGGVTHRIIGTGFQPGCTVRLAGIPVRSVTVVSPNILDVVSDAGAICRGTVEVTNPDGTVGVSTTQFEYYAPRVANLKITPAQEVIGPGRFAQFSVEATDQYDQPFNGPLVWEATGGKITQKGRYTAPKQPGVYTIRVSDPDRTKSWEADVTVGPTAVIDGRLQHWLVLGAFADPDYQALESPLLAEETTMTPSRDEQVGTRIWRSLYAEKDFVNLLPCFTPNNNAAAYAHVYLYAPAKTECRLVFGSDDGIRVWLNGDLAFSHRIRRSADPNQEKLPITLQPGWNRLLAKVDQGNGFWGFYMRLETADGKPLQGITYSLDRPEPTD